MKLSVVGFLFEIDAVKFKIGSVLQINAVLPFDEFPLNEKVRTIKHYDRFFRKPPKKNKQGEPVGEIEQPKRLVEAHFVQLKAENRMAIERYLMASAVARMKNEE